MAVKEDLVKTLGDGKVLDDPGVLAAYAESHSFDLHFPPWLAVKPDSGEAVESLVKWANRTKTPLVPVSSGGTRLRGGSAPSVPGAVAVDLSGMKKVRSVNRRHRIAVVEPGVTYDELNAALEKENLTLPGSLKPKKEKSVLASVLEGEPRLNPMIQWSYFDPLRCVEVTWGDGVRMFTGEAGGGIRDLEKQQSEEKWQVNMMGPWMLDFYRVLTAAQGSMGIVTWASLKCAVKPLLHTLFIASADKLSQLEGFLHKAMWTRFPDEIFVLNKSQLAHLLGKNSEEISAWREILPPWIVAVGVAGRELLPEQRFEARSKDLIDIAQENGLNLAEGIPHLSGSTLWKEASGTCDGVYWKDRYAGSHRDIFFVTRLDKTEQFLTCVRTLAEEAGYPAEDIGVYIQPKHLGSAWHMEFTFPYDPASAKQTRRVKALFAKASAEIARLGGYYSRPYGQWAGIQLNKDAQSLRVLKRLQGIFDPNGILNPGKLTV
ncbi:MAG: FAD-binding oxidoreductase [Clostridiales Family XIII bacterium]|nr:FAD-binding oxidoreductase [Clostridiales Family XIII bacterium]